MTGEEGDPLDVRLQSGGATHMALLRGTADSAWIVHWHRGNTARLWLADSLNDSTIAVAVPDSQVNLFCAGQAVMPDGRLMVVGGTVVGTTGENRVRVFNPKTYWSPISRGWSTADSMKYGRWYATVTTLNDGKMLATSGTEYMNLQLFGGLETGTPSLKNDARTLNLRRHLRWEDDQTPGNRPTPRHGHSAVFHYGDGHTVFFGGVATGAVDTLLNQVWRLFIGNTESGQTWQWKLTTTEADSDSGFPRPRHRHSAVVVDSNMILFGGLGKDGSDQDTALDDLWRLNLRTLKWKRDVVSGGPGPRFGHSAVVDNALRPEATMLVYGGRSSAGGTFAGDKVWALTINRQQGGSPVSWTELSVTGPGKREGHVAVMDTAEAHVLPEQFYHRMVVFGGERETAGLANDVWMLSRPEWQSTWAWDSLALNSTRPAARTRATAIYDGQWERLLVVGGDTTIPQSGGEVADVWGLRLDLSNRQWVQEAQNNPPAARQGSAAVFGRRSVQVKYPERLDAAGEWQEHSVGYKWMDNYPHLFQVENGKVFYAGNGTTLLPDKRTMSYVYDPSASTAGAAWTNETESEFVGGSSAITYAPNEQVMKCGAPDHHNESTINKTTRTAVVASGGGTTWADGDDLPHNRRFHNLTIVPDGRVLVSAGWRSDNGGPGGKPEYALTPYLGQNGSWGNPVVPLADDLIPRSYHSTAILLPDARILAAGGPPVDSALTATIFTPPYLYKNGTLLADRPWITTKPSVVHYGEPFYVEVNDAAPKKIVSLIRPGAVTHSFDMNQRYVQQSFTKYLAEKWLRTVLSDNPGRVPPGDYLLFVVDSTSSGNVPSVGKWVRIESEADTTAPSAKTPSITDLTETSLNLSWTAPGDNGTSGTAMEYELRRRADTPITEANFSTCDPVLILPPKPAGLQEQVLETGLTKCRYYWYGLRTRDERTNGWSPLTTISLLTLGCTGGGGGGGELPPSARPVEGAAQVALNEMLRLGPLDRGVAAVTLVHGGLSAVRLDSVRVIGVARGGDSLAVLAYGELKIGARRTPVRIDGRAGEITAAALQPGYQTVAGESLVVEFPPGSAGAPPPALVIETSASEAAAATGGIRVLEPDGSGTWYASAGALPGPGRSEVVVKDIVSDRVCLVFRSEYTLRSIARVAPAEAPARLQELGLIQAEHPRLGPVADVANGVVLEPGERIDLSFAVPKGDGVPQDAFLLFRVSSATATETGARPSSRSSLPTAFALGQNEPNPFGEGTVIRFALPTTSQVAIEVFDPHGRRVRVLTRAEWQAGHHVLQWNGRNEHGRRVHPGVYLYRMQAGSFRTSRKLVVLP